MLSGRTTWKWQLWAAFTVLVGLAAGIAVWLFAGIGESERETAAASDGKIARIEPRGGAALYVAPGATVRLDLDAYDGTGATITPTTQLIAWLVVVRGQEPAREAWKAMLKEAWNASTNPSAPLANIAGTRTAVHYTAPSLDSYIGTTVTVRAVVAKADCAAGGSSTIALYPPADWNGPCAADFTITIGSPPTETETPTATPETVTPTPETDPPGEAETHALTLTQSPGGRLAATPAGPYQEGATVTITATATAGYRLTAWRDACAGQAVSGPCTLTMNGDKTASATFTARTSRPLELLVISDGATNALTLEWTGGPAGVTSWQYRTRTYANREAQAWASWRAIPGSSAATSSYRVTGLTAGLPYDVQIRPLTGSRAGTPSRWGLGWTRPANDFPALHPDHVVEGDGVTKWRMSGGRHTFVIPDGMRLRIGRWTTNWDRGGVGVRIYDVASGSYMGYISIGEGPPARGYFVGRELFRPSGAEGASTRDVGALFDQIEDSLEKVPLP